MDCTPVGSNHAKLRRKFPVAPQGRLNVELCSHPITWGSQRVLVDGLQLAAATGLVAGLSQPWLGRAGGLKGGDGVDAELLVQGLHLLWPDPGD